MSDRTISWSANRWKTSNDFDEPRIFNRPYARHKWVIRLVGPDGKNHEVSRRLIQKIIRRVKEASRQEKAKEKIYDPTAKALEKRDARKVTRARIRFSGPVTPESLGVTEIH